MWLHDFSYKYFMAYNFLLEMSTFATAKKMTFGCNRFGKKQCTINRPGNHVIKSIKSFTNFIYQNVSSM